MEMISAIVLTHNDTSILARCLKSISWCDEVIVIDDQSIDDTARIAKTLGAKVFTHALADDFAVQRNFGLEKAKGEWVLYVDSDEVVSEKLQHEIKAKTQQHAIGQQCDGYYVRRRDYWGGRWLTHGEAASVKLLRLAKKGTGLWIQPVHETWNIRGEVTELAYPLLHYPHQNVAQFLEEINRYSSVYARFLYSQGVREPSWVIAGKPMLKFFVNYIWRLGFLDGTAGMVVALMMSFHSFLVRSKLWRLNDRQKKP